MLGASPRRRRIFSIVAWATLAVDLAVAAGGTIVSATGSLWVLFVLLRASALREQVPARDAVLAR